jgi:hypothetical protein
VYAEAASRRRESHVPTILLIRGWRFFFYTNEGNEPVHIHCQNAEREAKYWLDVESFEAVEAHAYNMSPADRRTVRRIILEHFDYIVSEWERFQEMRHG